MSKFLDRLEQIGRGTQTPIGFGVSRPEKVPGMALIALITSDHSTGVGAVAELAPDAALVAGGTGQASVAELTQPLDSKLPWGVRATSMTQEEVQSYQDNGCDLLAFPLEGTPVAAVASDEIARILCIEPDLEEKELRVVLDLERCAGAYNCWAVCPEAVFEKQPEIHKVRITHADRCIRCGACLVQCPQDALAFEGHDGRRIEGETIRRFKLNMLGKRTARARAEAASGA